MAESNAAYEVRGGIATILLDTPTNRNALTPELLEVIGEGLAAAEREPEVRAVVITNTGSVFSAGADLKATTSQAEPRWTLPQVLRGIARCTKPVIARIAGHCFGGGIGLAAACDLSVATDTAMFGFSEVTIGVAPAIISVVCLPKLSTARARELMLTGRRFPARAAAEAGLITCAVDPASLDTVVSGWAEDLRACAPSALRATKEVLDTVPGMEPGAAFSWAADLTATLFAGPDARAGREAFASRTVPPWAQADVHWAPPFP